MLVQIYCFFCSVPICIHAISKWETKFLIVNCFRESKEKVQSMNVFEIHFLKLNYEVKLFPSRVYQMGYRHKDNRVHKYDRMNKIKSCIVWGRVSHLKCNILSDCTFACIRMGFSLSEANRWFFLMYLIGVRGLSNCCLTATHAKISVGAREQTSRFRLCIFPKCQL